MTYPHLAVRAELDAWVFHVVDAGARPELAGAFRVPGVPAVVAVRADGTLLDRRSGFHAPFAFAAWLGAVRAQAARPAQAR